MEDTYVFHSTGGEKLVRIAVVVGISVLAGWAAAAEGAAASAQCPASTDQARFATTADLVRDNRVMADLGPRPTASPAHERFVGWLEREMGALRGIELASVPYTIDRWLERRTALSAGRDPDRLEQLPPSGAVPYARTTAGGGVTAPLVHLPPGTAIAGQDVAGKIVVRDVTTSATPYRSFNAVAWSKWDPDLSLTRDELSGATRERVGNPARVRDLSEAAAGGAAGVIMVHGLPREQVEGWYGPYEGLHWDVPALYVGADEGARLKELASEGGHARIAISASRAPADTRMLIATLPGMSAERIVVESHTDGVNAVWDNGPIAMLALARHFASLPRECRPRTLQFVFTTGHLYQRLDGSGEKGGSGRLMAEQLDRDYDEGTVAMVFAIEHLGAREYEAVPRPDGGPGRVLRATGRSEVNTFFTGESPLLVAAVTRAIAHRDIARSYLLRGADAPGARIPLHHDFGGEGGPFHRHLIPTVAFVTGPWTLFSPAFGMEALDGELMRRQTLVFSDLIHDLAPQPAVAIGGGYVAERHLRTLACRSALSTMGFLTCGS